MRFKREVVEMRSQIFLSEIKRLPCVICGGSPVDAAQSNQVTIFNELAFNSSDSYSIPLCRNHHIEYDQFQKMNRSLSVEWFNQMLIKTKQMLQIQMDEVLGEN